MLKNNNMNFIFYTCIWLLIVTKIICAPLLDKRQNKNDKLFINQEIVNEHCKHNKLIFFNLNKYLQIEFMQKFGYLDQTGPQALIAEDALVVALKLTQKFGGLEQTGVFDNNTLKVCKLNLYSQY